MKHIHVYTLFLMSVFHTSCGQNQTNVPQDNTRPGYSESQLKENSAGNLAVSLAATRSGNCCLLAVSAAGLMACKEIKGNVLDLPMRNLN